MQSCMLYGSETWPVKKQNEIALQWADMRMMRCGVKLTDKFSTTELTENLGIDDVITMLQFQTIWTFYKKRLEWLS